MSLTKRPKDNQGRDVVMGDWYWAMRRDHTIAGAGKFFVHIAGEEILFSIADVGYSPDSFREFAKAEDPWKKFIKQ